MGKLSCVKAKEVVRSCSFKLHHLPDEAGCDGAVQPQHISAGRLCGTRGGG